MTIKTIGAAALGAVLAVGLMGTAEAQTRMKNRTMQHNGMKMQRDASNIGMFTVAPGDSAARAYRAYPTDANPPSLRQTYNLRGRLMQESRN